ncbi:hypothetical protein M9H77_31026 [Catharanthus roseus]|uniref:Uncharacterized protein n=1 Tax=Catharanthus roseus TaxID=4058 RepID=A0ACB9ZZR5_CATRO|nr:hypothetical protein M9H77_31026 [Catharanthus roseus]
MSTPSQQWLSGVRDLVAIPNLSSRTSQTPPAPSSGFTTFKSPHPSAYGFGRFRAPHPPGTAGASTPHQPISEASLSDEEEGQDALGRGHRVFVENRPIHDIRLALAVQT